MTSFLGIPTSVGLMMYVPHRSRSHFHAPDIMFVCCTRNLIHECRTLFIGCGYSGCTNGSSAGTSVRPSCPSGQLSLSLETAPTLAKGPPAGALVKAHA